MTDCLAYQAFESAGGGGYWGGRGVGGEGSGGRSAVYFYLFIYLLRIYS